MPYRHLLNRADEYRRRAQEACSKLEAADDSTRQGRLQDVDTWERRAASEDANNPSALARRSCRERRRDRFLGRPAFRDIRHFAAFGISQHLGRSRGGGARCSGLMFLICSHRLPT